MKVKQLNNHIEQIATGLKHQVDRYKELLGLSAQLESLITAKDVSEIEKVVAQKGEIIDKIREIESHVDRHKKEVMSILHLKEFVLERVEDLINPSLRQELEEQKKLVGEIVTDIIKIERKNREGIMTLMKDVSHELQQIQQHHEVQQAYLDRPDKFVESRFFDHKK